MTQTSLTCFAITAPGLEALAEQELQAVGITPDAPVRGGVSWNGTSESLYAANLWLRTASRIVVRIATFRAITFAELERKAKRIPWGDFVVRGRPVRFRVTCRKSRLYHSDAVAQRLAASVAPFVGDETLVGVAQGNDEQETSAQDAGVQDAAMLGGQLFVVRLDHDQVTISVDASGALLHRRGYRQAVAKAPLRETLAAAMVLASGWDLQAPLIDPLCGSGTIAIEAALLARRIAPGRARTFAFMQWPGFDAGLWSTLLMRAREHELERAPGVIRASDRDAGAARAALENAERAEVAGDIDVSQGALSAVEPAGSKGWMVTNPPYGVRVGDPTVRNLYAQFGNVLRKDFRGWNVGLLSADQVLDRQMRLDFERMFSTSNGGIPVRFVMASVPGHVVE